MKRVFLILLSIIVVLCQGLTAFAAALPSDFTLLDLSGFGLPNIMLSRPEIAPVLDGTISSAEYGTLTSLDSGSGLVLKGCDFSDSVKASQTMAVAFCGDSLYVGTSFTLPAGFFAPQDKASYGKVYSIGFALSLSQGDHPLLREAGILQDYFFSSENSACVGVSGRRILRATDGSSRVVRQISNTLLDCGYTDADGVLWNGPQYCRSAAFSRSRSDLRETFVFEIRIPLGDALLSVPEDERASTEMAVLTGDGSRCGAFRTTLYLSKDTALTCGIDSSEPLSSDDTTAWKDALSERYGSGTSLDVIPLPLYLAGSPIRKGSVSSAETSVPAVTTQTAVMPPVPETEDREIVTEDEALFADLPDEEDMIPEETQILPYDGEEEEASPSFVGSILSILSGVLVIAAVIAIYLLEKHKEKKDREELERLLAAKRKKKSSEKTKNN